MIRESVAFLAGRGATGFAFHAKRVTEITNEIIPIRPVVVLWTECIAIALPVVNEQSVVTEFAIVISSGRAVPAIGVALLTHFIPRVVVVRRTLEIAISRYIFKRVDCPCLARFAIVFSASSAFITMWVTG